MSLKPIEFSLEYTHFQNELNTLLNREKAATKLSCCKTKPSQLDLILIAFSVTNLAIFILSVLAAGCVLTSFKSDLWKLGMAGLIFSSADVIKTLVFSIIEAKNKICSLHNRKILTKVKQVIEEETQIPDVKPCTLSEKNIPPEVMRHIFSFLTVRQLGPAACVSKNWRALVNHPLLWTPSPDKPYLASVRAFKRNHTEIARLLSRIFDEDKGFYSRYKTLNHHFELLTK